MSFCGLAQNGDNVIKIVSFSGHSRMLLSGIQPSSFGTAGSPIKTFGDDCKAKTSKDTIKITISKRGGPVMPTGQSRDLRDSRALRFSISRPPVKGRATDAPE